MKVLIAEDNSTMRIMMAGILKRWGHQPVLAADGEEAWQIIQQPNAPQIAILDWEMPRIDGVEVCRRLRAREKEGEDYTYTILLTSRSEKQEIANGIEAGADDYILKPFDQLELRARMRTGNRIIQLQKELLQRKEEYRQLLHTDPLTGCRNRQAIMEKLHEEMIQAKRAGRTIGVSMMDIDHFKHINDRYGHAAGDEILRQFTQRLEQYMHSPDIFGRVGGEEFLGLWASKDNEDSLIKANESFRFLIESAPFLTSEIEASLTVSIGVTTTLGDETVDAAIARADQALNSAKDNGWNRIECC
jgi:two-component system, cell cycle response regulator